jgi:phage repressor protein C with HTH and peptisase S24 domain
MITTDRLELNARFIQVFKLLEDRGVIVKNDREGRGMGDFAERVLDNRSYGHIVRAFLNPADKRVISYHQARKLCQEYGINEQWMLHGKGSPFGLEPAEAATRYRQAPSSANILFTSVEAFAGSTVGADSFSKEEVDYFSIPGLSGKDMVSFPINGNSMEPVIQNGDIVICEGVDSPEQIRDNEIYAVKSNGSLWVKYVQKIPDAKGWVRHLRLISANHLEHDPFEEEVNEYTRIYRVVRRICNVP